MVWISDITYLRTREGWLYLCAVRDGGSCRVLGWALDSVQNTGLVERALRMAHTVEGGLAIQLHGNIFVDGAVVKTSGVDEPIFRFFGPSVVFESRDPAVEAILSKHVVARNVVVIC